MAMASPKRLALGDRGALMLMAAFIAIFLVAVVYQLAGIGGAALEQQVMQDAADAVTFSAATADARGMNMLALINLIMSAVMAVLVALRLLEAVLAVIIIILGGVCAASFGATCALIGPAAELEAQVVDWAEQVEEIVKPITNALDEAGDVINQVVPILAQAEAVYVSTQDIYDPAEVGFVWPIADELPTKTGTFEELCAHAAGDVVDTIAFFVPFDLGAVDEVGDLFTVLAVTFSDFFCGASDSLTTDPMEEDVAYPINDHTECAEALPNLIEGDCTTSECEQCSVWGCATCLGAQGTSGYQEGLWTVKKDVWVEWNTPQGKVKVDEAVGIPQLTRLEDDPCDGDGVCGDPVCVQTKQDSADEPFYPQGAVRVTHTRYIALHSCIIEEELEIENTMEQTNSDDWGRPRVLDEEQFPEAARLRGFVLGDAGADKRLKFVAVAAHGQGDTDALPARVSFAGAEFFSPDADLWNMTWRSRLIRFRMSADGGEGSESMSSSCSGDFASECEQVGDVLDGLGGLGGLLPSDLSIEDFLVH